MVSSLAFRAVPSAVIRAGINLQLSSLDLSVVQKMFDLISPIQKRPPWLLASGREGHGGGIFSEDDPKEEGELNKRALTNACEGGLISPAYLRSTAHRSLDMASNAQKLSAASEFIADVPPGEMNEVLSGKTFVSRC